jgi:16S rRNA (cytosine967-C5)-methyltransferase
VLVYSTCSLEPEENSGVVQQFLALRPDFQLETERQLLPFADGVDGAYVARLVAVRASRPGVSNQACLNNEETMGK